MYCQACGCDAPTRYVSFHQNIGALLMRFYEGVEGNLCKNCIHGYFWKYLGVNMTLGWWGTVSLIVNPFFILNNVFYYVPCLFMDAPGPNAAPPELTEKDVSAISPFTNTIINRLGAGESLETVAADIGAQSGTSAAKVFLYIQGMAEYFRQNPT